MLPTRLSLFSLVAAGFAVAAQGPLTSSLEGDSNNPIPTLFTTIRTTVVITLTSLQSPTTITSPPVATTTLFVSSTPPPITTTTTVYSSSHSSSSSNVPTNVHETPMESGTLPPVPTISGSGSITHNPGALAGLIIGICVVVAGLVLFALFTIRRHKLLRELEDGALESPPTDPVRRSASARGVPLGNGQHRAIDGDPDLEVQSSIGHAMRASPTGHDIAHHFSPIPGEIPEQQVDFEAGYFVKDPTVVSSNGQSSPGHGTAVTRNSSLTQGTSTRNPSPTLSRPSPRFSHSMDRGPVPPVPSSWQISRSEAPTRRGSVDDGSIPYHLQRVNSDPVVLHHDVMSMYPRRQSSELHRPDMFQLPGPHIVVHPTPTPNLPSSLLRPPPAQIPTRPALQRSHSSAVYLDLPLVNEQTPSPTASNVSILPMRQNLLGPPPHPTASVPSLSDGLDYARPLSAVVVSGLRDSTNMTDAESDSELNPNRDSVQRRSTLG